MKLTMEAAGKAPSWARPTLIVLSVLSLYLSPNTHIHVLILYIYIHRCILEVGRYGQTMLGLDRFFTGQNVLKVGLT